MNVEKIMASQQEKWLALLSDSKLLFPFYPSHSEAVQRFLVDIKANDETTFVLHEKKHPYIFVHMKADKIDNLLVSNLESSSWRKILSLIEKWYKQHFRKKIGFLFANEKLAVNYELFSTYGFQKISANYLEKELHYQTALVLGGGGARGAYQIGVWQALKEHHIPISYVTGTSVGALNGALIIQDDFERAKKMWEEIETKRILSFPVKEQSVTKMTELLEQLSAFTFSAIQTKGVSTQPLQELIQEIFDEKKLKAASMPFSLVVTKLPGLKEKVISMEDYSGRDWKNWLLASASFFPAMAAAQIGEEYYIDGGYRNNVPVDVAVARGATECLIVDVKGPGITKPVFIPESVSCVTLKTPWSMGNILLFDGTRSATNIQLGYLEMMKVLEKYRGYWYTFSVEFAEILALQEQFLNFLSSQQLKFFETFESREKICRKLRNVYKDRVDFEHLGMVLLELLGKDAELRASELYTIDTFCDRLNEQWSNQEKEGLELGLYSLPEWLKKYYDEYFLLSEKQQLRNMTVFLANSQEDRLERIRFLFEHFPVLILQILFKEFILQGVGDK